MNPTEIGKRLRELRGQKRAVRVANDLGISRSTLLMYERGQRVPRDEIKLRIARYYGESVEAIFYQCEH